jgi:hypothetical protein
MFMHASFVKLLLVGKQHNPTSDKSGLCRSAPRPQARALRPALLADDWLPKPRILHPWPNQRFAVKHPR